MTMRSAPPGPRLTSAGPVRQPSISTPQGVEIEGWRTGPAEVSRGPGGALRIVIHEGHKRQIRLMCQAVGLNVERLVRVRIGPLTLGRLKPGEWRELRPAEVRALFEAVGLEQ